MAEPVPQTPDASELRARVGSERWSFLVEQALERAEIVEQVAARVEQDGAGRRQSLRDVAPEVGWSRYLHWRRRHESREGPGCERLLDERLPPPPVRIGDDIRLAACMLRRQDRSLNAEGARTHLVAQFGEAGRVSDSSLRRIWSAAGLTHIAPEQTGQEVRRKDRARTELERQRTMPREIYARDTGRDSVMTCLKFMALMLLEFVLKEYFGGAKMQWRTFIEQFMFLPVTERKSSRRCLYQIHESPRQPETMDLLRGACEQVTGRRLRRDGRLLAFELVAAPDRGS